MCERPNHSDQIPKDRTQPNHRGAGGGAQGQGGGTGSVLLRHSNEDTQLVSSLIFILSLDTLQELERLKEEVESANGFQFKKESLSLKLQVSKALHDSMWLLMLHSGFSEKAMYV